MAACAALAACGSFGGATSRIADVVRPYKVDVVQGNFVSKEQVEALQRGMTRSQVKEVLGTPLMTSLFHADRWDYVFTLKRQGVAPQSRRLTLFFQGEQLDKWEGDEMPTEAEFVAQLDSGRKSSGKAPLLEVPEEVLKEFNLKNPPAPKAEGAVAAAAAATPQASYPPLEAPGTASQAWDASTQRAVVASASAARATAPSAATAPLAAAPAAPSATAAAPARAPATPVPAAPAQAAPAPAATVAQTPAPPGPASAPAPAPASARTETAASSARTPPAATAVAAGAAAATAAPPPRPASPPPVVSTGFSGLDPEVASFLNGWMNDWQARNASSFFARYAPEFHGTSANRADWEAQRRPLIDGRRSISLGVQDVRGVMASPTNARVVFRQVYDSDASSEIGTKALFLVKRDGRWLIEREFFTPAR